MFQGDQGVEQLRRFQRQPGQNVSRATGPQPHDNVESTYVRPMAAHGLAEDPADVVSVHRAGELLLADDITDPPDAGTGRHGKHLYVSRFQPASLSEQPGKGRGSGESLAAVRADRGCAVLTNYTASRARPLARRARNTLRPPAVFILLRKPWVRLRRTTDG